MRLCSLITGATWCEVITLNVGVLCAHDLLDDRLRLQLVGRVDERVEEEDPDHLGSAVDQLLRGGLDLVLVQRDEDIAGRERATSVQRSADDPLADADHHPGLDERRRVAAQLLVEDVLLRLAEPREGALRDHDVVPAAGDDQADPGAAEGEDRVQDRRARVDADARPPVDVGRCQPEVAGRVDDRLHVALRLVLTVRQRLADMERPVLAEEDAVGHRAAGVDRDDELVRGLRHRSLPSARPRSPRWIDP